MAEFITHSRAETVELGRKLAQHLAPGALVCFTGSLGRARPPSPRGWRRAWAAPTR